MKVKLVGSNTLYEIDKTDGSLYDVEFEHFTRVLLRHRKHPTPAANVCALLSGQSCTSCRELS